MRKYKTIKIKEPSFELPKLIKRVSPGVAIRTKTWTGFGKGAGLLGYDSDDSRNSESAKMPNVESENFVGTLFSEIEDEGNNGGE